MTESPGPRTRSEDGIPSVLHILTLCCIAFALPLLDLLGRTAEFLVIRHIGGGGIFVLLVALILIVPLPIVALVIGSERLTGRKGARVVGWLVLTGLSALIMLRIASATGLASGSVAVVIAVMAGSAVAVAYQRSPAARSFVTFLSPALLVVPLAFILQADVRRAVISQERTELFELAGADHPVARLRRARVARARR